MNETAVRLCQLGTTFKKLSSISIGNNILTSLNGYIFTSRTIGIGCFSIATNDTIVTNGTIVTNVYLPTLTL